MPALKAKKLTRKQRKEQAKYHIITQKQLPKNLALQIAESQQQLASKSRSLVSNENIEGNFIDKNQTWTKWLTSFLMLSTLYQYINIENWSNNSSTNQLKTPSNSLENSDSSVSSKFIRLGAKPLILTI